MQAWLETSWQGIHARVLYDFIAQAPDTLRLSMGDTVTVLGAVDENWWAVARDGGGPESQGLAPTVYLDVIRGVGGRTGRRQPRYVGVTLSTLTHSIPLPTVSLF